MINSLEDAIKHCEEVAERLEGKNGYAYTDATCEECANEHKQLAQWLKELKKYRAIFEKVGKILADNGYTIDDLDTIFGKVNGEVNADEDSD